MPPVRIASALALWLLIAAPASGAGRDMACLDAPWTGAVTGDEQAVAALLAGLEPVLTAFPAFAEALASQRPALCLTDTLHDAHGFYSPDDNSIVIDKDLPDPLRRAILLHELRHVQQYLTGTCPTDDLSMAENARATFAIEADASAITLLAAWQMRDAGAPDLWDALAGWPSHADIAAAFADRIAAGGDLGQATSAAFEQWYASSWRVENYYIASCSAYLDRQDATKTLPRYLSIDPAFFENLCRLPDGSGYACAKAARQSVR